uniref:MRG domain binding protein n=1 Tax=Equus caballus TaxID=9796 RepID=A0A9L0R3N3_HORSE
MGEAEVGGGGAAGDKGPGEAATSPAEETVVWSPEVEVCLFHAMLGHKPVGVNRHFHMICIRDKFSQNIGRQVPSKVIWDHLSTMYDMQALHESEILPFPNPERNFVLPEEIIQEVREGKVIIEEEMKEEMKEDVDPHNGADDVKKAASICSDGSLDVCGSRACGQLREGTTGQPRAPVSTQVDSAQCKGPDWSKTCACRLRAGQTLDSRDAQGPRLVPPCRTGAHGRPGRVLQPDRMLPEARTVGKSSGGPGALQATRAPPAQEKTFGSECHVCRYRFF